VDVVRADVGAGQPAQQIILFVRRAVRADKTDGVGAVLLAHLLQAHADFPDRILPTGRFEFPIPADQRLPQALRMAREVEAEAAFRAEEFLVDTGEVAVVGTHDFVVADAQSGLATVRPVRAERADIHHLPRSRPIAVGAAGQCADGADVDTHAALFTFEVVLAVRDDHRIGAAVAHAERLDVHALVANAHTAEAE